VIVTVSPSLNPTARHTVMDAFDGSVASGGAEDRQPLSPGLLEVPGWPAGVDEDCPPPPPWCAAVDEPAAPLDAPRLVVCDPEALALLDADFDPCADPEPPAMPVGKMFESTGPGPPLPLLHAATSMPAARTTAPARHLVNLVIGRPFDPQVFALPITSRVRSPTLAGPTLRGVLG
jgi:hypothetical protein